MADHQTQRTLRKLGGQFALLASMRDRDPEYIAARLNCSLDMVERIFLGKINDVPLGAVLGIAEMIGGRISFDLQMLPETEFQRGETDKTGAPVARDGAVHSAIQPEFIAESPRGLEPAERPNPMVLGPAPAPQPEKRQTAMQALAASSFSPV